MSNHNALSRLLKNTTQSVSGAVTEVVSETFPVSIHDSHHIEVDIVYDDAVVAGGTLVLQIQSSNDGGQNWDFTHGSASIAASTATRKVATLDLSMHVDADQASLPIRPLARVVVVSDNAGNSVVVDKVIVSRRVGN